MSKIKKNNFWTGEGNGDSRVNDNKVATVNSSKNPSIANNTSSQINKSINFEWWWIIVGLLVIGLVVLAVVLNSNHSHTGDNASNIAGTIDIDNGDSKINWDRYPSYTVELSETYTITTSGTYYLSGSINDGSIIIKTDAEAVVRLVLSNVTIKNSNGPTIACYSGDDLVIELVGENNLEDGATYDSALDEDVQGAIYSKADLSFQGDGTLNLKANYQDGIVSKDDLTFRSGIYNIEAADDGIRGKDSVNIIDGTFTIKSGADAIKSTNETDTTKGFVLINNGTFDIVSGAKGIKAINSILIYGGKYTINSTDDAIHSNNYVGVTGGDITINSGDDGIHADARLIIDGGNINITKSYEGLEAQKISINNGDITIISNDDGINAGGGADASANNRAGAGAFDMDENCELAMNGGNVYINSAGDGADSNGYLYFNGGTVVIDGPTNNGNGAIDSGAGVVMNGGTVIAVGASGMAETLGSSSSIYNVSIYFTSSLAKDTEIEIKNSAGEAVISHTAAKTFNHMSAGTDNFVNGETYTIYINGTEYESFTINNITTVVGNSNANYQNMNMNGNGAANQKGVQK